jgi:hypothetical protein
MYLKKITITVISNAQEPNTCLKSATCSGLLATQQQS